MPTKKRKELVRKYLANFLCCPYCGSGDLKYESFYNYGAEVCRPVICKTCGKRLGEIYTLSGIEIDSEEELTGEVDEEVVPIVIEGDDFYVAGD